jgi:hypothetical protein
MSCLSSCESRSSSLSADWSPRWPQDDLALLQQASAPELLRDFGSWQDVAWRRDTLALH